MDACFFDMDGVIVDSERHWVPLENERILPAVVEAPAGEGPTASEITGMNVRDLHGYLEREYETKVDEDAFVVLYDDAAAELYEERVSLLGDFERLVASLEAAGVAVALVSSSPHRWIDCVLDRFALHDAFDAVVSADDVDGPGKPAPDVYEYATERVGVEPTRGVAVEDSTHGLAAATAAGLEAIGYRTATNADADLSEADAVAVGADELARELRDRRPEPAND